MPQFLILLWEDENRYAAAEEAVFGEIYAAHEQFAGKHEAALRGGNALQEESTGKIVRDGTVTDGPFVETKEALGGYYLIEADDLDAAVEIAKDVPARFGYAEVRPIRSFD